MFSKFNKQVSFKRIFFYLVITLPIAGYSQKMSKDRSEIIKMYSKVMSFTDLPYLHYTITTKLDTSPIIQPEDTLTTTGDFYKNNLNIYSNNSRDEVYIHDSLMVQISNTRRTIWISKVSADMKVNAIHSSSGLTSVQQLLQQQYIISKKNVDKNTSSIFFESHLKNDTSSKPYNAVMLLYNPGTNLPQSVLLTATMQQIADEAALDFLRTQAIDSSKLLKNINGVKYLVRTQQMLVTFSNIESGKDKLIGMPVYYTAVSYDATLNEYIGVGKYKEYEITKLF